MKERFTTDNVKRTRRNTKTDRRTVVRRYKALLVLGALLVIVFALSLRIYKSQNAISANALSASEAEAVRNSPEWADVFANKENYPEALIKDLERNPEMLEYVMGYPTSEQTVTGGITNREKAEKCPLFIQWDSRWGYAPYGSSTIGIAGCGPTCLSMVIYSLTRDESATPDVLSDMAMNGGYYVPDAGTSWSFLTDGASDYGISAVQTSLPDEETMIDDLDAGKLMICSMGPGDFTDQGHFIVIYDHKKGGFAVNDPFSYTNSSKKWDYAALAPQIVQVWIYG